MTRARVPLGDALEALIDHRGKTPKKLGGDWSATGHRVVSALNIKASRVDGNDHHYISEEMYQRWMKVPLRAGDVLLTSEAPTGEVAYINDDVNWALGQRVFGLRGKSGVLDGRYLYYALRGGDLRHDLMSRTTGTTVQGIRQSELVKVHIELPALVEQRAIASTLGALDDKVDSNLRQRKLLRSLGHALLAESIEGGDSSRVSLDSVVGSIARGVAPKYADDDADGVLVLNQKCVRDGWVSTAPARRMHSRPVAITKRALSGDILVNSTGVGTLGRVGRWADGEVFVDGHVSVVRPNPSLLPSTVLAYAVLSRQDVIEGMATGSTGQTELSPSRLGSLELQIPAAVHLEALEESLLEIENRIHHLSREIDRLETLRDRLLPDLLAGRVSPGPRLEDA